MLHCFPFLGKPFSKRDKYYLQLRAHSPNIVQYTSSGTLFDKLVLESKETNLNTNFITMKTNARYNYSESLRYSETRTQRDESASKERTLCSHCGKRICSYTWYFLLFIIGVLCVIVFI